MPESDGSITITIKSVDLAAMEGIQDLRRASQEWKQQGDQPCPRN